MSIDVSRVATDFLKLYRGVRMQQGRVLTDDDFNEAQALDAEDTRTTRVHTIGALGSPDDGFLPKDFDQTAGRLTFTLSSGTLYLGGHRLQIASDELLHQQSDWLNFPAVELPPIPPPNLTRRDLVWIEAWEQPVTATEDATLFEVALGGPDTTARQRIMRRIHVAPNVGSVTCDQAWNTVAAGFTATEGTLSSERELRTPARLRVSFNTPTTMGDLCSPTSAGGYLGAENQAIRVQMVDSTHYTWGYDNAAPLYRVRVGVDNRTLTFLTPPRDAVHWPVAGQVVEVLEWSAVLANGQRVAEVSGAMSKVGVSYDPDTNQLVLTAPLPALNTNAKARTDRARYWDGTEGDAYVFLRVWNRGDDLTSAASIQIPTSLADPNARLGNSGYSVTFLNSPLRRGDHWIITARPAAPDQILPAELKAAGGAAANGVRRFRAPLALIEWRYESSNLVGEVLHDCRHRFKPLVEARCCEPLVAEPGWGWERIFDRIGSRQDAVICFPPGDYPVRQTVEVQGKGRLILTGAGKASRLVGKLSDTQVRFFDCDSVEMRDLYCFGGNVHSGGIAGSLAFDNVRDVRLLRLAVRCKSGRGRELACVRVTNAVGGEPGRLGRVTVQHCDFYVGHLQNGLLITNATHVSIKDNRFVPSGPKVEPVWSSLRSDLFLGNLAQTSLIVPAPNRPLPNNQLFSVQLANDARFQYGCDESMRVFWQRLSSNNEVLRQLTAQQVGIGRVYLMRRLRAVLESGQQRRRVEDWLNAIDAGARAVIGQAIVIGGQRADQVAIQNNQIGAAAQGIHVGLSHQTDVRSRSGADSAGRVIVGQNRVDCTVAAGAAGERHAIFIGNARSVTVLDNDLSLTRLAGLRHLPVDGIRIFGFLGGMAQVRSNHTAGFTVPVRIQDRGAVPASASRVNEWNFP